MPDTLLDLLLWAERHATADGAPQQKHTITEREAAALEPLDLVDSDDIIDRRVRRGLGTPYLTGLTARATAKDRMHVAMADWTRGQGYGPTRVLPYVAFVGARGLDQANADGAYADARRLIHELDTEANRRSFVAHVLRRCPSIDPPPGADFGLLDDAGRKASTETVEAVRRVIVDWDGQNWAAVRAALKIAGESDASIDRMTVEDVRQYFAVGQERLRQLLGGMPNTTAGTIIEHGVNPDREEHDEPAGPALTPNQQRVLQTMARFDASRLLSCAVIAPKMDPAIRLSEEAVRQCVAKLIELNLAERPEGERSGARLTIPGRKLAGKIAD